MRGGTEMGTLTISRFFVAHVFLIPAFIFALVASHIFLFRKAARPDRLTKILTIQNRTVNCSIRARC
jgi:quinol-cytochrome oxidoreductase complex cytochrome b subunit